MLHDGIAAYRAGDRRGARQLFIAVTQRDPRNEMAWLWLSATQDDADFRRICLEKVLAINPANAEARRGLELLNGGPAQPSMSVFSAPPASAPARPAEPPARPPLATLRARPVEPLRPKCPWCAAEFNRAPTGRCPRCGRHLTFDCPGCERPVPLDLEACPHCGHVLGQFFADREAYLARLVEAYRQKGWVDQALTVSDYLLELAPGKGQYYLIAAQLYGQLDDTVHSVNAYRRTLDLDPENAEALAQLGRWYLSLHQTPELKEIGDRLRQLKRRSLRLTLLLADIDFECDNYRSAEPLYSELLRSPDLDAATRARLHYRLGAIAEERGDLGRAVRAYQTSLAVGVDSEDTSAARRRLDALRPPLPMRALSSYGETLRAMAGPVLLVWTTAALQVGFRFERLTPAGLAGLVLAVLGSYLAASALVTPLTPEWREALGPGGLTQPVARAVVALLGAGGLAAAGLLVLFGM